MRPCIVFHGGLACIHKRDMHLGVLRGMITIVTNHGGVRTTRTLRPICLVRVDWAGLSDSPRWFQGFWNSLGGGCRLGITPRWARVRFIRMPAYWSVVVLRCSYACLYACILLRKLLLDIWRLQFWPFNCSFGVLVTLICRCGQCMSASFRIGGAGDFVWGSAMRSIGALALYIRPFWKAHW